MQFGIWPNKRPAVDIWQRVQINQAFKLTGNLNLKPDTGYGLLMAISKNGELKAVIWDLASESNRIIYKETLGEKWMGKNWSFGGRADGTEALFIDDIYVISFGELK